MRIFKFASFTNYWLRNLRQSAFADFFRKFTLESLKNNIILWRFRLISNYQNIIYGLKNRIIFSLIHNVTTKASRLDIRWEFWTREWIRLIPFIPLFRKGLKRMQPWLRSSRLYGWNIRKWSEHLEEKH